MEDGSFQKLFSELSSSLAETRESDVLTLKFKKCVTDSERVRLIIRAKSVSEVLSIREYRRHQLIEKSDAQSEKFRADGNYYYKKKNFNAALLSYTKSVFSAPCTGDNTTNISLALANRSAVLFHMADYNGCIQDAEQALVFNYPNKLKYKLLDRLARVQMKMGKFNVARETFQLAIKSLNSTEFSEPRRNEILNEILKQQKIFENELSGLELQNMTDIDENCKAPAISTPDRNRVYPCAMSCFDIKYDSNAGRSAIAARDIEAGELILVEEPFASVIMPDKNLTHCHHCLCRCIWLTPCLQCCNIGFCSEQCRNTAWQEYHNVECCFLHHLHRSKIDFGHLSLRMVIKTGFQQLMCFTEKFKEQVCSGLNSNGVYDSFDYESVYSLVGHSEDRSLSDLFRRTVMAVFLLKFIEHEPFFMDKGSTTYTTEDKKVCIGSHILKQLQMLPCNAHEISELLIDQSSIANSELKEIGSAIYATLSLLNHSCDPSVVRHSYKDSCALRAIKHIPKGGEIIDNYGALYAVTELESRQSLVSSQYYFTCMCDACTNHWPLYTDLPDVAPIFKCLQCNTSIKIPNTMGSSTQCSSCEFENSINVELFDFSREKYLTAMESVLNGGNPAENLPSLLGHMQLVSKHVQLPWLEFNNCQEIVKQCYSMLANHHYLNA
eukprot:gene7228-8036_t